MVKVPEGWVEITIGDLIIGMAGGLSPKSGDYSTDGILVLNKGDIKALGKVKLKQMPNYLPINYADVGNSKLISKGAILVTLRDLSQKADFLGLISKYSFEKKALITQGMYALNITQGFIPDVLVWFSNSHQYRKYVKQEKIGATQVHLRNEQFLSAPIPLPPLAEQKIIADKLDTLLAQVEATKARLEAIPNILKRFRQSVLAAAVSGKLTEEWRSVSESKPPLVSHNKKLPEIENIDKYSDLVTNWLWVRLGSVVNLINGDRGKNYPNQSEYVELGIPFINTGHIEPNGTLSYERMNYITKAKYESLGSGKTQPQDLVYCLRGATMGKTARVNYDVGAIASSLVIVRPSEKIDREFAYYFLISPQSKKLITEFDNGSAQPNLSAKSLACYPIQLPPLPEQLEITRRVEQLFAYADTIAEKADAALARVNNLTQSILAQAFRGELTADWRAANPDLISGENSAEALLSKIKAERGTKSNKKGKS